MFPFPPPFFDTWQLIAVTGLLIGLLPGLFNWMLRFKPAVSPWFPGLWLFCSPIVLLILFSFWSGRSGTQTNFELGLFAISCLMICLIPSVVLFLKVPRSSLDRSSSLVVVAIALYLLAGLFLPGTHHPAFVEWRTRCRENLGQLVRAMNDYYDRHQSLPLQVTGEPPRSWRVDLLPWIEQQALYQLYSQGAVWNEGVNLSISKTVVPNYSCRAMPKAIDKNGMAFTSYALVIDPDGIYSPEAPPRKLTQVPGGVSQTVLIVEACGQNLIWTDPHDIKTAKVPMGVNLPGQKRGESNGVFSSYHPGGANIAFADGSTRFLSQNTSPEVLKSLINANDRLPDDF